MPFGVLSDKMLFYRCSAGGHVHFIFLRARAATSKNRQCVNLTTDVVELFVSMTKAKNCLFVPLGIPKELFDILLANYNSAVVAAGRRTA